MLRHEPVLGRTPKTLAGRADPPGDRAVPGAADRAASVELPIGQLRHDESGRQPVSRRPANIRERQAYARQWEVLTDETLQQMVAALQTARAADPEMDSERVNLYVLNDLLAAIGRN